MKKVFNLALTIAVAAACSSASAGVLTFEGITPTVNGDGEIIQNGYETITTRGMGAIIDGTDPDRCDVLVCPAGSTYYAALNDGGVSFGLSGSAFNLSGLDFAFLLPVDSRIGFSVGQLIATGRDGTSLLSVSQDFAMQVNGKYGFAHWNFDGSTFGQSRFTEVTFSACLYTDTLACVNPAGNQAQFAIDNIAFVPEPGTMPLFGLSLLGMLAAYRRRKSA